MNQEFRVGYSGFIREQLKRLLREAARQDSEFGKQAVAAVRRIEERLRIAARDFGEPTHRLQKLRLQIRLAGVFPISVTFAVHEEQDVVFVTQFRLMSPRNEKGT